MFYLLTRGGVPKVPYRWCHEQLEEGRMTPTLPLILRPGSLHSSTFCRMLCCFLSHLILTLSWCLKYKTRSRWEKFASASNPFFRDVQITIRAAARITRNTTHFSPRKRRKNVLHNENNVEQHELLGVRCEPPTPWRDPRTGELARSGRKRASTVSSKPLPQQAQSGMFARPAL